MENIKLEIGDFLGFCDMNGEDALTSDQLETLEGFVKKCQESQNNGESLVSDAIYDRMMEILRHRLPESELVTRIWEDSGDTNFDNTDSLFLKSPMYSIQTVKSLDCQELSDFIKRLPDNETFEAHISFKENGWGIRCIYVNGDFVKARTRARSSNGRDITPQLAVVLEQQDLLHIAELESFPLVEIRGEVVVSYENFDKAKEYKSDIRSPFSAVSSMIRDSATKEEWGLLHFIAYRFIADGMQFNTKEEEYEMLDDFGFETPTYWVIPDLSKSTLVSDLQEIISDCEQEEENYQYYTDGLVFEINDRNLAESLGDNGGNYKFCNIALKVGIWKQDMYSGFVQTIVWMKGKTKVTPVAIIAEDPDVIEFTDLGDHMYVSSIKEIENFDSLGVVTASGNRVRRVPLYEPCNLLALDAYKGNVLYFRYGGESGVLPCYPDGTPLVDGRAQQILNDEEEVII